ncbi:MAG: hypothetical protein HY811_01840 [Planctomycetes bacterium]|nr:hypothetical protein [Planctomycetota bacterium]
MEKSFLKHYAEWFGLNRKRLIRLGIYFIALIILVGGRGWFIAHSVGGYYPFANFIIDLIALSLIIIILRLFNYAVKYLLKKIIPNKQIAYRIILSAIHILIITIIAGSFLITTLQLHPQRMACRKPIRTGIGLRRSCHHFRWTQVVSLVYSNRR